MADIYTDSAMSSAKNIQGDSFDIVEFLTFITVSINCLHINSLMVCYTKMSFTML